MFGKSHKRNAVACLSGWLILCGFTLPAVATTPFMLETVDATGNVGGTHPSL